MARTWPFNAADFLQGAQGVTATQWNTLGKADYTLAFWLKLNGHGLNEQTFLSRYNGIGNLVRLNDTHPGKLGHFWIDTGNAGHEAIGATTVTVGVWHHVAAQYTAATRTGTVWLDGTQDGTATAVSGISQAGDNKWRLGLRGTGVIPADASLAEVGFWQTLLPQRLIVALSKGASPLLVADNVIAYFPTWSSSDAGGAWFRQDASVPTMALTGALATASHAPVMWPVPRAA